MAQPDPLRGMFQQKIVDLVVQRRSDGVIVTIIELDDRTALEDKARRRSHPHRAIAVARSSPCIRLCRRCGDEVRRGELASPEAVRSIMLSSCRSIFKRSVRSWRNTATSSRRASRR